MPALAEYRTRALLEREGVPLVPGSVLRGLPETTPAFPVFLKAQIPGATSRKKAGLVRRIDSAPDLAANLDELLSREGCECVLMTSGVDIERELYCAVVFDGGSSSDMPGGRVLFSESGGSGIESRAGSLVEMRFPLSKPPSKEEILKVLPSGGWSDGVAGILAGMVGTFLKYRLLVLEANPVAILRDGRALVVDCRAEFESRAVRKGEEELFGTGGASSSDSTRIERAVEAINRDDPAGTAFFRQNRADRPAGAAAVATNLCGGGGKMLWEMATGGREDIFPLNESDTSGGLSAFKSYRFLRAVLSQEEADLLFFTGSGMAFQSQLHIAAAIWKALRESPRVVPFMVRFGGTDEDKARALFERVSPTLRAPVRTYPSEVFPNAMVDDIAGFLASAGKVEATRPEDSHRSSEPAFEIEVPPGRFHIDGALCAECHDRPCLASCPTKFLAWEEGSGPRPGGTGRCIGCLMCEAVCRLDGRAGLFIELGIPEVE